MRPIQPTVRPLLVLLLMAACSDEQPDDDQESPEGIPEIRNDVQAPPDQQPEGGSLAACAGLHVGVFEGDEQGAIEAELLEDGLLLLTFQTVAGAVPVDAEVSEDGAIVWLEGEAEIVGAYLFDGCVAVGGWSLPDFAEFDGDWSITHQ